MRARLAEIVRNRSPRSGPAPARFTRVLYAVT